MTREDANFILANIDRRVCDAELSEALDIAIKALSAEPCEDTISRQAVLDAFNLSEKTRKYGGDHSGYDTMMLYEIQDVIEDLPSVTPKQEPCDKCEVGNPCLYCKHEFEPKHKMGHWKVASDGYGDNAYICECSECKDTVWVYKDADRKWNY